MADLTNVERGRMRILFITGEYPPQSGGVGDYTQRLGQTLANAGHEILVLTIVQQRWRILRVSPEGDQALSSDRGMASWRLIGLGSLIRHIRRLQPDWCHIQYQTGAYGMHIGVNVLPTILRHSNIATAITYHDLLPPYLFPKAGMVREWVTLLPARTATAVIVTNPEDEAKLRTSGLQPHLIPIGANIEPVLPPDYDRTAWRSELGVTGDKALIGYFGLLSPSKGIDLLIDVVIDHPQWHLLIIGGTATSATDRAFAEQVYRRLSIPALRDRVIVTGHVTAGQVSAHLSACDLVVLPFRDGASLRRGSLLAALAHGCAVITTPPASSTTAAALTGVVQFAAARPDALTTAITTLLKNPIARTRLSEAARTAARRFDWQAIGAAHIELYQSYMKC
jgi:Glycosyltransferase